MVVDEAIFVAEGPAGAASVARMRFEPSPDSVREARAFARERVDEARRPTVELLVSELATNALRHARTRFEVAVAGGRPVRIEVRDGSTLAPRSLPLPLDADHGRGIEIVAALARRWGVETLEHGKVVWFEL